MLQRPTAQMLDLIRLMRQDNDFLLVRNLVAPNLCSEPPFYSQRIASLILVNLPAR